MRLARRKRTGLKRLLQAITRIQQRVFRIVNKRPALNIIKASVQISPDFVRGGIRLVVAGLYDPSFTCTVLNFPRPAGDCDWERLKSRLNNRY